MTTLKGRLGLNSSSHYAGEVGGEEAVAPSGPPVLEAGAV
jgi:hypothetical protein